VKEIKLKFDSYKTKFQLILLWMPCERGSVADGIQFPRNQFMNVNSGQQLYWVNNVSKHLYV